MKKICYLFVATLMMFQQFVVFADNIVPKDVNERQEEILNKEEPVIEETDPLKDEEPPVENKEPPIEEVSELDSEIKDIQPTPEKEYVEDEIDHSDETANSNIEKLELNYFTGGGRPGDKMLPYSPSGMSLSEGSPNLANEDDLWKNYQHTFIRRFIETYLNDLFHSETLGYAAGDYYVVDVSGPIHSEAKYNGYSEIITSKMKRESPSNATAPGLVKFTDNNGTKEWFMVDAADTLVRQSKKNEWINNKWRGTFNSSVNGDGQRGFYTAWQYYNGMAFEDFTIKLDGGNFDLKYSARREEVTITRSKTSFDNYSRTYSPKQQELGHIAYKYYLNLKEPVYVNNGWISLANKAPMLEWGQFYPMLDFRLGAAPKLEVTQNSTPKVTEGDSIAQWFKKNVPSAYFKSEGLHKKSSLEFTPVSTPKGEFSKSNDMVDIDVVETLGDATRSEKVGLTFEVVPKPVNDSYVEVYHEDESGKKLLPSKKIVGKVGDDYDVRKEGNEKIEGYELTDIPYNATGTYKDGGISVHFVYKRKFGGDIYARYFDEQGKTIASMEKITGKLVGESYTTTPKVIEGFKLKEMPENATGTVTDRNQYVYYRYIKDESIRIETPSELILSSKDLIIDAPLEPSVMPDRQRISEESLAAMLTTKIKGYYSSGGDETEIPVDELAVEYVGLADVPYSPTRAGPIDVKVTGRYNNLVSETQTIKVTVTDGIVQIVVPEDLLFNSKLSSKLNAQTELSKPSKLVINDQRYAEDGWMVTVSATEFVKADRAKATVPVSDMDLVARIKDQSEQSLIQSGGISFNNQSEKLGNFDLNDKESRVSLYLATRKSQSWAKLDGNYRTTVNWDLSTTLKTSEVNFMAPQLKKEVD